MGKIVGLTFDVKEDWPFAPGDPKDANAEFDPPKVIDLVEAALTKGGHTVKRIGNIHRLLSVIDHLDVDIVFNLCEGISGRNRESQVPLLLELKGIPYVGADALTLGMALDKVVAKKLFIAEGIPTPRYFVANDSKNLEQQNTIGFPLMVKSSQEGSSKGISEKSRVEDFSALKKQVDLINKTYHQPALVEEFIRGREFTIAVLGNGNAQAMPVVQTCINGKLEAADEFFTYERIHNHTVRYLCPAKISAELAKRLQDLAVSVYQCVNCRDFGRIDFRVDKNDNPYVLEINPLPSLSDEDIFNLFPQVLGSDYDAVVNRVLHYALKRYGLLDDAAASVQRDEYLVSREHLK
jgi:D-alanine-D-alanine ligase